MPTAVFLIPSNSKSAAHPAENTDNATRLPAALHAQGWTCFSVPQESVHFDDGRIYAGTHELREADIVWPLGFGARGSFMDRLQILSLLPPGRLINPPGTYVLQHGKLFMHDLSPPTFVSNDAAHLERIARGGDTWVLKPLADSHGNHVIRVESRNPEAIRNLMTTQPGRYFALQRYIPAITEGEVRTLIVGDAQLGTYLRKPVDGLHANLARGAAASLHTLNAQEHALVDLVHGRLQQAGIRFAAIDQSGGYLVEVNIANPGGFGTLERLGCPALSERFSTALTHSLARCASADQ